MDENDSVYAKMFWRLLKESIIFLLELIVYNPSEIFGEQIFHVNEASSHFIRDKDNEAVLGHK